MILCNRYIDRERLIESLSSDEVGPRREISSIATAATAEDRPRSISFYRCVRTRNGTVINFAALGAPVARVPSSSLFFPRVRPDG